MKHYVAWSFAILMVFVAGLIWGSAFESWRVQQQIEEMKSQQLDKAIARLAETVEKVSEAANCPSH